MRKNVFYNKENSKSVFQNTSSSFYFHQINPAKRYKKIFQINDQLVDNYLIENDSMNQKIQQLKQKISQKVQNAHQQLQFINNNCQQEANNLIKHDQNDTILKQLRQKIKDTFSETTDKQSLLNIKYKSHLNQKQQTIQQQQKMIQQYKYERQHNLLYTINEFESQILTLQKQLKSIRMQEDNRFENIQLILYELQQNNQNGLQAQIQRRKQQHETIVKLIFTCIQNLQLIY